MALEQDQRIADVVTREQSRLRQLHSPARARPARRRGHPSGRLLRAGGSQPPADADRARDRLAVSRRAQPHHRSLPQEEAGALQRCLVAGDDDERLRLEDLLPSPDAGPDALYARNVLLDELELAVDELPAEQRDVFVGHELEGRSFKEMAAETGVSVNTLLSRKRYAVRHLRERLQDVYDDFTKP